MGCGTRKHSDPLLSSASFLFNGCLQNLLVRKYRATPIIYPFKDNPGIKDAIEAMGVPHTEVDVILVNNRSVDFSYQLHDQDLVSVFPVFSKPPVDNTIHLSPLPSPPISFVLDVHLGKLTKRLRLLGFDCCYRNDLGDAEILRISQESGRVILTRDLGILKHRCVKFGYLIRSDKVEEQIREVLSRFRLATCTQPFLRCMVCNGFVEPVKKNDIVQLLEPRTKLYYEQFHRCRDCHRIYWQGSHFENIKRWLDGV